MDSHTIFTLLLLLLLTLSPFPHLLQPPPTFAGAATRTLIETTCKSTKHYDLCLSSLKSNSNSSTADVKGLALIMIGIGMANATSTSSYLSSHLPGTTRTTTSKNASHGGAASIKRAVLKECADKYMYAGGALQSSVEDVGMEEYDYASMHVMAAADYPNACHNAFRRYGGSSLAYPPELGRREDGLRRICDVVLGMIDLLIVGSNN